MGACLSSVTKVSGSCSSNAASAGNDPAQRRHQQKHRRAQRGTSRREEQDGNERQRRGRETVRGTTGLIPCGKRTNFGYARDFESGYAIGKLLGHGQFGYTFVATDKVNGDRVAVKRIDKNKAFQRKLRFRQTRRV